MEKAFFAAVAALAVAGCVDPGYHERHHRAPAPAQVYYVDPHMGGHSGSIRPPKGKEPKKHHKAKAAPPPAPAPRPEGAHAPRMAVPEKKVAPRPQPQPVSAKSAQKPKSAAKAAPKAAPKNAAKAAPKNAPKGSQPPPAPKKKK